MTKKNFTRRITSMVCAAVLSAGLAISSLPAGALAVHAEENTQVQEVTAETGTAGTDKAGVESAEPQPLAAPEASAEETAPVEAEPAVGTAPADQEVAAEPVTETAPVVAEEASATPAADTAPATETETTADVESATEAEQQAAASLPAPDETPADDVVTSAPVATEAPEIEVSADKAADAALSEAAPEEAVESKTLAENAEAAAEAQTPGEPTAITELATKAEAVAAKEQADETQETAAADEEATSEDSVSEKAAEESVSEKNTADMEDSTLAAEAGSTEETVSEEDAAENSTDTEEEASPALALRMLAVSADAAAGALGESGTADEKKVIIDYDKESDIHSVKLTGPDGAENTVVLFCMNNQLHWPHKTGFITPPEYKQSDINDFKLQNGQQLSEDQKSQIKALLYAGYPNNGFSLFQIVEQDNSMDVGEFNKLLIPPVWIRSDFPDLGAIEFTYENSKDNGTNKSILENFLEQAAKYYPLSSATSPQLTPSGHTYTEIQKTLFWNAAYYMVYSQNPISDYCEYYGNGTAYVTEKTAYTQTSNAIWHLMYNLGVENNNINSLSTGAANKSLSEILYEYSEEKDNWNNILEQEPSNTQVTISGDGSFKQEKDGLWKTGILTLEAPGNQKFTLTLPEGVTTEDGNTEITPGTQFVLVTNTEPANKSLEVTADATAVWMDGDLKIYTPAENYTDSAGKGFQSMIGALIRKTPLSASITLSYAATPTDDSNKPSNEESETPQPENPSGPNEETPATPTDPSTPETPAAEDNDPGTPDNTTDNKNTEPTDPVTNNTTESSDPVETNTTPGTDPVVTNNTQPSDPVVTRTTVASTPTVTNTTAEPAVINEATVSAPVVTDNTTATAPQIVSTPVSNGETIVTGDESQMGLYLTLFAAAAAGLAVWFAGKHKKNFR